MSERPDLPRRGAAEALGAFALVFAGCGAIVTDTVHPGSLGASMNPARSIGPALVSGELHDLWIYIAAPIVGAAIGALAYQLVHGAADAPTEA
jgi:aquaporin Z